MTGPVPIAQLKRRIPGAGRIRTGTKTDRGRPTKLETFRFTSADRQAIEEIAAAYGGTPRPWKGGPTEDQWEVITEADEVRIVLPPDPLGDTPSYELWSGGGRQRKCDGETCQVMSRTGPEDAEQVDTPCICAAKGALECKIIVRLFVLLPDIKFGGGWRLDTGSEYAARELPGMVDLIQSFQSRGLTRGLLALEQRKKVSGGQTRRFAVPVLRLAGSMDALAEGDNRVGSLGHARTEPDAPSLAAPEPEPDAYCPTCGETGVDYTHECVEPDAIEVSATWGDGEVEAEIIEDGPGDAPPMSDAERAKLRSTFHGILKGLGLDYPRQVRPWMAAKYDGRTLSDLEPGEYRALVWTLNPENQHDRAENRKRFKAAVEEWCEAHLEAVDG